MPFRPCFLPPFPRTFFGGVVGSFRCRGRSRGKRGGIEGVVETFRRAEMIGALLAVGVAGIEGALGEFTTEVGAVELLDVEV